MLHFFIKNDLFTSAGTAHTGNMQRNNKPTRKKSQPCPSSSDIKLPKIAKITMPEDFKIKTQPLFSLPQEVLKLPPPPSKRTLAQAKVAPKKRSSGKLGLCIILCRILE